MNGNKYTSPSLEEIKIKIDDVMAESLGEGSVTDEELFG